MPRFSAIGLLLLALLAGCGSGDDRQPAQPDTTAGKPVNAPPPAKGVKISIVPASPVSGDCLAMVAVGRVQSRTISWFLDADPVQGGESGQYCIPEGSRGRIVRVVLGEAQDALVASVTVGNAPPIVLDTQLKLIVEGVQRYLESTPLAKDADGDEITFSYKWYINGEPDNLERGGRRALGDLKKGDLVKLEIVPNDGTADGPAYVTLESPFPGSPPLFVSKPPASFRAGEFAYQVNAKDPDGDPVAYSLENPPPGAVIDAKTGLLKWPLSKIAPGEYKLIIVAVDPEEQKSSQEFSINVTKDLEGN